MPTPDSDTLDWSQLEHAYGSAEDVPSLLEACRTDADAPWELAGSIIHQGSLYTATPVAMPMVAHMAADPDCAGRLNALNVIRFFGSRVAQGVALTDPHSGVAGPAFDSECRAAFLECVRIIAPLIDDPDPEVGRAAVTACSWLDTPLSGLSEHFVQALTSDDALTRGAAVLGLARQGSLTGQHAGQAMADNDPKVRFAAAWALVTHGDVQPDTLACLAEQWSSAEDLAGEYLIESTPEQTIADLPDPLPVLNALVNGPSEAATAAVEALEILGEHHPDHADVVVALARKLAHHDDPTVRRLGARLLAAAGEPEAHDVQTELLTSKDGILDRAGLSALVDLIGAGEEPGVWLEPLVRHLEATTPGAMDHVDTIHGSAPLPAALRGAKTPYHPRLIREARRHLAAATDHPGPHNQAPIAWAVLICEWGEGASQAVPELIAALPYAPNPCARALAIAGDPLAIAPLEEAFAAQPDPSWIALALTDLTSDGTWCEQALTSGKAGIHSWINLLTTWAKHPTPSLVPTCRGMVTGQAGRSFPERRAQLTAIEILYALGDRDDLEPTIDAIIAAGGTTQEEARQVAERLFPKP